MKEKGSRLIYLLLLIGLLVSCGEVKVSPENTKIRFVMPKSNPLNRTISSVRSVKTSAGNPTIFGQTDIATIDDVDCYVVLVSHDDGGKFGNCTGDFSYQKIKLASQTVADGEEIEINDVPVGVNLKILIMGMKNHDGSAACPDFRTLSSADMSKLSRPMVVGIAEAELKQQVENSVDVDISFSGAQLINGCSDGPIKWAAGGVYGAGQFGNTKFGN